MKYIELEILGLSSALSSSNNTYALILKEVNGVRRLPVIIGAFEAQAIALELENFKRLRPLTHDLFADCLRKLNAFIKKIVITEIKEGIFYSTIFLENEGSVIELDARPSDAVAMAVRFNCPIFVNSSVLDEAGVIVKEEYDILEEDEITKPSESSSKQTTVIEKSQEDFQKKIQALNKQIEEAILNEDYELAAKLRDEIKRLQGLV